MNEQHEQMIERLVEWIEARGLRAAAILLLEANKPLACIGAQALIWLDPLLGWVGWPAGGVRADEWADLLEHPAGVDLILERLERGRGDVTSAS